MPQPIWSQPRSTARRAEYIALTCSQSAPPDTPERSKYSSNQERNGDYRCEGEPVIGEDLQAMSR